MKSLLKYFTFFNITCSFLTAQNNDGDSLFNAPIVHDLYLNFSQTGYWDSLVANYSADVYMKCDVVLDGRTLPQTGVKFKGNSSYNNPSKKKSWKLDFDEYISGQDYNDLKKLNLNNGFKDPTLLREKIALDYCKMRGIPAPRCAFARVYLNNVYWGLYTIVEEINKDFLDDRFYDKKGNLFKGDPTGDLKWYGSAAASYYTKYELKTNETTNNWSDLVHLIDEINNSTTVQLHDSLEAVMNTNTVISAWASTNLFVNLDSYLGSGHNYYVYHDSLTNKFNYIVWDVNESFANFNMGMTLSQMKNLSIYYGSTNVNRPLYSKMLSDAQYKSDYTMELCNQAQYYFSNTVLDPIIDSLANAIRADVYADTLKSYSNQNFEDNIIMDISLPGGPGVGGSFAGLKPFITSRRTAVINELSLNGCAVGVIENNSEVFVDVYPNPANDMIHFSSPEEITTIEIFSIAGKSILKQDKFQADFISVSSMSPGIYFIRFTFSGGKSGVRKFTHQ
jgi:spore coat protein CotH